MNFENNRKMDISILTVLLILGIITRFIGIGYQSLWIDEGSTFYFSHMSLEEFLTRSEPNSPVYYWMEGFFLDVLGQTEFGIRFSSAVAGAVSIVLIYLVCNKIFKSKYVAVFAAVFMLISPYCLHYSQEARGYAIVMMLFLLQVYILLYALETRKCVYWIILSFVSAIQFSMQFAGLLATIALFIYALYYYKDEYFKKRFESIKYILGSAILFIILSSPLIKIAYDTLMTSTSHEKWSWCHVGLEYVANVLSNFLFIELVFILISLVLFGIGLYKCYKKEHKTFILLLLISIFPILLSTLLSYETNMTPRYILWSITGFYMVMACSLVNPKLDRALSKKIAAIAVVLIIAVAIFVTPSYYTTVTKEDFRGSANWLESNAVPGDLIIYAPYSEVAEYATISFYYDPESNGVGIKGFTSIDDMRSDVNSGKYGTVYLHVSFDYAPHSYLENMPSEQCTNVFSSYGVNVFNLIGPIS